MDSGDNKQCFEQELYRLITIIGDRRLWFTRSKLKDYTDRVASLRSAAAKKRSGDYGFLGRYDIVEVKGVKRLVRAGGQRQVYLSLDQIYDAIDEAHVACGHGGEKRTEKELSRCYANVTMEQVKLYLSLCHTCLGKKSRASKVRAAVSDARHEQASPSSPHHSGRQVEEAGSTDAADTDLTRWTPTSAASDLPCCPPKGTRAVGDGPDAEPGRRIKQEPLETSHLPSEQAPTQEASIRQWAGAEGIWQFTAAQTEEASVAGTVLQTAIYFLKTMPEFQSIHFEVRQLPTTDPVLHLRRADLYGQLGWPCDPLTSTLTTRGILTHRVVYLSPRHIPMLCEGVAAFDVDGFIRELRWMADLRGVCMGLTTASSPSSVRVFHSPEPRLQAWGCPVVLDTGHRRCSACHTVAQDVGRQSSGPDSTKTSGLSQISMLLPGCDFGNDSDLPPGKKPKTTATVFTSA